MTQKKSAFNFDKTVAGFNITEHGLQSFTHSFKLGPIRLTLNARNTGVRASIALPGSGLSKIGRAHV